ncbi:MAG: NTP transferase domain-containing protein [Parahaliea sp.]
MNAGVLLLAAGLSRRFGGDKRFARLPDGGTVLVRCIEHIQAAGLPLVACLRPQDEPGQRCLAELGVALQLCPGASDGMGTTLAQGIVAAQDWDAALVALADMPFVSAATFRAVAAAAGPEHIAVPFCEGRHGHPVAVGARYFGELAALSGDAGARELLARHADRVRALPLVDRGIWRDIDRPADLPR